VIDDVVILSGSEESEVKLKKMLHFVQHDKMKAVGLEFNTAVTLNLFQGLKKKLLRCRNKFGMTM
jgi:hypothetical protein